MPSIKLHGVRQNNLKNLSLEIPLEKLVCITGPSGSGKSSLAFETLYAEGYRRYVESLSTYARQFLERLPRPDLDSIENICPSIALQQTNPVRNSRSTVGTTTEIYDYLRVLYSKIAEAYCPSCNKKIKAETAQSAAEEIMASLGGEQRAYIGFPLATEASAQQLLERGFLRRLKNSRDAEALSLEDHPSEKLKPQSLIVYDRLVLSAGERHRLIESLEGSFREGGGNAFVMLVDSKKLLKFSSDFRCAACDESLPKPTPLLFSFNSPLGACAHCKGFGNTLEYDEKLIVPNARLSLEKGAIEPFTKPFLKPALKKLLEFAKKEKIALNISWQDLSVADQKKILSGSGKYKGVFGVFKLAEKKRYKVHVRVFLRRYQSAFLCTECHGARLRSEALQFKVKGKSLHDLCLLPLNTLETWLNESKWTPLEQEISKEVFRQVGGRLRFINRMGLSYLTLQRLTKSLSGGECQRINLANQLGAELSGTLYVLDEPSVGLHPSDRDRLIQSLRELIALGNTAVVVEHDLTTVEAAEEIIELGPGSGRHGGAIVFQGSRKAFLESSTLTAQYIRGEKKIEIPTRNLTEPTKRLSLYGACENNLKSVTLHVPLNRLVSVAGVSGSGKSTLIHQTLHNALARLYHHALEPIGRFEKIFGTEHLKGVVLLDQSPPTRSSRSIPLTMIGAYDDVRSLFAATTQAKHLHLEPKHFSFNVNAGRCETCGGEGVVRTEMFFLDDLFLPCDDCEGKRFKKPVLQALYRGKSIDQIFKMTVKEAKLFFSDQRGLVERFELLERVGLDYLLLGQGSQTLSGGESQRMKIASELLDRRKKGLLYILDEPTTGLHMSEVSLLIRLLRDLVDQGNTVVVIEHQVDVLRASDWLIEMGPDAGEAGGHIVAHGLPEAVAQLKTRTAPYLRSSEEAKTADVHFVARS